MSNCALFLGNFNPPQDPDDSKLQVCYLNLLETPFYQEVYRGKNRATIDEIRIRIEIHATKCDTIKKQGELLAVGVGLFNLFIQKNFTGPDSRNTEEIPQMINFDSRENILEKLTCDGETVISAVQVPEVFLLSKIIFQTCVYYFNNLKYAKLWYLRCLFIHQQILEEFSEELFKGIDSIINYIRANTAEINESELMYFLLESARIYMHYQHVQTSKALVADVTAITGTDVSFTGIMGKRTKHQAEDVPQLIIVIDGQVEGIVSKEVDCSSASEQPVDMRLDDDVRLHELKLRTAFEFNYSNMTEFQQTFVLAFTFQTEKSQPKEPLANEELQSLINCLVKGSNMWSIRMATLVLRCKLESSQRRTVERAMMQAQVLLQSMNDSKVTLEQKFYRFFNSYMVPRWEMQAILGNIYLTMGCLKSALGIFKVLNDFDKIVLCYNSLHLRHKARQVIEEELRLYECPKLYILLGDATDDVSHYEKAWTLSGEKSAKAQRHWGYYYFSRKQYGECIEHFQKSLELNSFQKEVWYHLGYAALVAENWEVAASAYRRYCVLDTESFEAWNNLGKCYCELKQFFRAWKALKEALKLDYSNWKIWDNYMVVSCELRAFDEVIKSYHEIINLKGRHMDLPLLRILVDELKTFNEQEENETGLLTKNFFRTKLLELLGRLTSMVINDPDLWLVYSNAVEPDSLENVAKKTSLLSKAYRSAVNRSGCYASIENCTKVLIIIQKMVEVGLETRYRPMLYTCRTAISSSLGKIKEAYPDLLLCDEIEAGYREIDAILNED